MSAPRLWLRSIRAVSDAAAPPLARAESLASRDRHDAAFPLFATAAHRGSAHAQYRLGRCYLLGLGVPLSVGQAVRWLRRAAEAGEPTAQTQLAALALQGMSDRDESGLFDRSSGSADFVRAEHWCRLAAASGSAEAKALLAYILTAGPEQGRDPTSGEQLYQEAAEAGWSGGQMGSALTLLRDGTQESAVRALDLLHAAASDGVAPALHLLGVLAETGLVAPVDFAAAAAWYREAAALGHVSAQVRYGFALLHGRGVERDLFHAESWLRRAALAGDAQAAAVLGYLYARDGDMPPNFVEAAMWLLRAAEGGHAGAARTLGRMLMLGTNVPKDMQEAARWLRFAAEHGDEIARADLMLLVLTRQVEEDERRTIAAWLRDAATAGNAEAQYDLGLCLAQGIGVAQDNLAALSWVQRSAAGGHAPAMRMVAQLSAQA